MRGGWKGSGGVSWIAREGRGVGNARGGGKKTTDAARDGGRSLSRARLVASRAFARARSRGAIVEMRAPGDSSIDPRARVASRRRLGARYAPGGGSRRGRRGLGAGHPGGAHGGLAGAVGGLGGDLAASERAGASHDGGRDGEGSHLYCVRCCVCRNGDARAPLEHHHRRAFRALQTNIQSATRSDWFPEIRCSLRAMHGLFSS